MKDLHIVIYEEITKFYMIELDSYRNYVKIPCQ